MNHKNKDPHDLIHLRDMIGSQLNRRKTAAITFLGYIERALKQTANSFVKTRVEAPSITEEGVLHTRVTFDYGEFPYKGITVNEAFCTVHLAIHAHRGTVSPHENNFTVEIVGMDPMTFTNAEGQQVAQAIIDVHYNQMLQYYNRITRNPEDQHLNVQVKMPL